MKKFLLILTVCIMVCLCGCSEVEVTNAETNGEISPQFIVLEEYNSASGLCYDKDTKVIYLYSLTGSFNAYACYSYTPYYVMDTNNEPVIAVYNGDEVDE